jgi:biopolymer transport protein ExbD
MSHRRKGIKTGNLEEHLDLVPMIDCVFLLILFFVLCGRISLDQRLTQIAVPPTKTADKFRDPPDWTRIVITVRGTTRLGENPAMEIGLAPQKWEARGDKNVEAYKKLREALNNVYDRADKLPKDPDLGLELPKVIVELRADANAEYRVIQEVQQIITDTIIPETSEGGVVKLMQPRQNQTGMKPFNVVDFTAADLKAKQ